MKGRVLELQVHSRRADGVPEDERLGFNLVHLLHIAFLYLVRGIEQDDAGMLLHLGLLDLAGEGEGRRGPPSFIAAGQN